MHASSGDALSFERVGEIIERVYRYPGLYFSAWDEDRIIGVVPMVLLGGRLRRKSFVSMPYLDYGGILC